MSDWKDLLESDPVDPAPAPSGGLLSIERFEAGSGRPAEWRLGLLPEPPPDVVCLWTSNARSPRSRIVRVPLGPNGEPRGWWWVEPGQPADTKEGWSWTSGLSDVRTVQEFPMLPDEPSRNPLAVALANALPRDGIWHQIGVTPATRRVWAVRYVGGTVLMRVADTMPSKEER